MSHEATSYELARDATLTFLERKEFAAFAIFLVPCVLGFGGLWFFLLIGLHSLRVSLKPAALIYQPILPHSHPRSCAHRCTRHAQDGQAHYWQNASIQVLTACMAYAAVVSLPYRAANVVHPWLSKRSSMAGLDFYGRHT